MSFLTLPGSRLFYLDRPAEQAISDAGALGVPTVLVHGLWDTGDSWLYQLPHLGRRCRTVTVDLRGHGHSTRNAAGYAIAEHAADVAALIRHRGLGPVVLIGHSMGGSVATAVATDFPQLVRALILVDPDYAGADVERTRMARLAADLAGPDGDTVAATVIAERLDRRDTPVHLREWHQAEAMNVPGTLRAQTLRDSAFGAGSLRFASEAEPILRRRVQPVLAFHRDNARRLLDERCCTHPSSHILGMDNVGHWAHQERPRWVNPTIDDWLALLPAESSHGPA